MVFGLGLLFVWLAIGFAVASLIVPWRDIAVHARFAPMRFEDGQPPRSPWWVAALFWWLCVALWPFAWRWVRLGVFDGTNEPPLIQVPPDSPKAD